eukprot:g15508.t1
MEPARYKGIVEDLEAKQLSTVPALAEVLVSAFGAKTELVGANLYPAWFGADGTLTAYGAHQMQQKTTVAAMISAGPGGPRRRKSPASTSTGSAAVAPAGSRFAASLGQLFLSKALQAFARQKILARVQLALRVPLRPWFLRRDTLQTEQDRTSDSTYRQTPPFEKRETFNPDKYRAAGVFRGLLWHTVALQIASASGDLHTRETEHRTQEALRAAVQRAVEVQADSLMTAGASFADQVLDAVAGQVRRFMADEEKGQVAEAGTPRLRRTSSGGNGDTTAHEDTSLPQGSSARGSDQEPAFQRSIAGTKPVNTMKRRHKHWSAFYRWPAMSVKGANLVVKTAELVNNVVLWNALAARVVLTLIKALQAQMKSASSGDLVEVVLRRKIVNREEAMAFFAGCQSHRDAGAQEVDADFSSAAGNNENVERRKHLGPCLCALWQRVVRFGVAGLTTVPNKEAGEEGVDNQASWRKEDAKACAPFKNWREMWHTNPAEGSGSTILAAVRHMVRTFGSLTEHPDAKQHDALVVDVGVAYAADEVRQAGGDRSGVSSSSAGQRAEMSAASELDEDEVIYPDELYHPRWRFENKGLLHDRDAQPVRILKPAFVEHLLDRTKTALIGRVADAFLVGYEGKLHSPLAYGWLGAVVHQAAVLLEGDSESDPVDSHGRSSTSTDVNASAEGARALRREKRSAKVELKVREKRNLKALKANGIDALKKLARTLIKLKKIDIDVKATNWKLTPEGKRKTVVVVEINLLLLLRWTRTGCWGRNKYQSSTSSPGDNKSHTRWEWKEKKRHGPPALALARIGFVVKMLVAEMSSQCAIGIGVEQLELQHYL